MSSFNAAVMYGSLARSQLAIVPLAALALVAVLFILWRRLAGSRSCEGQTSTDRHQYQSGLKARTDTPLPSTPATHSDASLDRPKLPCILEDDMIKLPKQPYDAFLVLDVEGTCVQGSGFDYPNEIIVSERSPVACGDGFLARYCMLDSAADKDMSCTQRVLQRNCGCGAPTLQSHRLYRDHVNGDGSDLN